MPVVAFGPEIIIISSALLVLLLEIISPRKVASLAYFVTGIALLAAFANSLQLLFSIEQSVFFDWANVLRADHFAWMIKALMTGSAFVIWLFSWAYLREKVKARTEFYFLFLTSLFGLMLVASSIHFIMFIVALETAGLGMYVLAAIIRSDKASTEAGLKFFFNSAFASAIMIWGLSILYGLSGDLGFTASDIGDSVMNAMRTFTNQDTKPFPLLGILALFVGIGFKITLFPFHLWAPDVYQGSPTPFTAFLATVSKAAGIAILIRIVAGPLAPLIQDFSGLIAALACFTMIAASSAALLQTDAKRLLAYSSISHAGFMVVGIAAVRSVSNAQESFGATIFYLGAYILATVFSFIILMVLEHHRKSTSLNIFNGLWRSDPMLTFAMIVFVGSLAGLPPTIGFLGKFFIFIAAYKADMMLVLACMVIATVISLFFYFKIIRCMILNPPEDEITVFLPPFHRLIIVLAALAVVFLMFFSGPIYELCIKIAPSLAM